MAHSGITVITIGGAPMVASGPINGGGGPTQPVAAMDRGTVGAANGASTVPVDTLVPCGLSVV